MSTEHIKRIAEMNDDDFAAEIERMAANAPAKRNTGESRAEMIGYIVETLDEVRKADAERFSAMLVILERTIRMYTAKKVKACA